MFEFCYVCEGWRYIVRGGRWGLKMAGVLLVIIASHKALFLLTYGLWLLFIKKESAMVFIIYLLLDL